MVGDRSLPGLEGRSLRRSKTDLVAVAHGAPRLLYNLFLVDL